MIDLTLLLTTYPRKETQQVGNNKIQLKKISPVGLIITSLLIGIRFISFKQIQLYHVAICYNTIKQISELFKDSMQIAFYI